MRHIGRPYGDLRRDRARRSRRSSRWKASSNASGLHNIRSHSGTPTSIRRSTSCCCHGLGAKAAAQVFDWKPVWGYPMTTRIHFVECSGNSNRALGRSRRRSLRRDARNVACSEWTGAVHPLPRAGPRGFARSSSARARRTRRPSPALRLASENRGGFSWVLFQTCRGSMHSPLFGSMRDPPLGSSASAWCVQEC